MDELQETTMRRWTLPLTVTVAGLGGLGLLYLATRGRATLHRLMSYVEAVPDALREFNDAAETEITRLQSAVDDLARSLRPTTE